MQKEANAWMACLQRLVLLRLSVHVFPDREGLIGRHIRMDDCLAFRCQRWVKLCGNGKDADILRRRKVVPVIDHQVMPLQVLRQPFCINACRLPHVINWHASIVTALLLPALLQLDRTKAGAASKDNSAELPRQARASVSADVAADTCQG